MWLAKKASLIILIIYIYMYIYIFFDWIIRSGTELQRFRMKSESLPSSARIFREAQRITKPQDELLHPVFPLANPNHFPTDLRLPKQHGAFRSFANPSAKPSTTNHQPINHLLNLRIKWWNPSTIINPAKTPRCRPADCLAPTRRASCTACGSKALKPQRHRSSAEASNHSPRTWAVEVFHGYIKMKTMRFLPPQWYGTFVTCITCRTIHPLISATAPPSGTVV